MQPEKGRARRNGLEQLPTGADVARAAGVSPAVVSRVISDDRSLRIRPDTRERVLAAAKSLGYTPHGAARALRLASSGALCLVVDDIASPLRGETLRGAQLEAERAGYLVVLGGTELLARDAHSRENLLGSRRVDGVALHLGGGGGVDGRVRRLVAAHLPTVLIGERMRGCASATVDDIAAAAVAVEHLVGLGHADIGFVAGDPGLSASRRRRDGVERALSRHGLRLKTDRVYSGGASATEESGRQAMLPLVRSRRPPSAIVFASLLAAVGALATCREHGVSVPGDLSVVAIDDGWFAEHTNPPLTTVRTPLDDVGAEAIRLLIAMLRGEEPRNVVVGEPQPELVARGSTARASS